MHEQNKKVIYYYYDEENNRRLLSIGNLDTNLLIDIKAIIKFYKQKNPNMDNLYIQIDGVEFKLF
ncbi:MULTISPECIES: hypothetical protein [Staphylococcus]|uniref:hypothetical protein n=1 Tax=Staphylococcus TaxID=1279 RepID=UPI0008A5BF79|nr:MULTISPECIES: hypothetical protein [Staphylococcus]MCD8869755.1 hypothetical protein [Staphylococcus epidermidis]MCG1491711.1 hypothetical protein [Staphylococcus epidermidis]MCG2434291.1 hypothetical protein [Staphylococcus epidermidis]MEB6250468.1 hypothetical protein [Staphylococcus epidermidis]OFR02162.1 hypothetical protein HMPREF2910_01340 [Staphylococcus sp. HMSC066C03]